MELSIPADPDAFGRFSERVAHFFGTAKFLAVQTVMVLGWMVFNLLPLTGVWHWDPYPFILLNLGFSTQAAYAAPLILLAETRQAERERAQGERDRQHMHRVIADTEYLARELAALRIGQGESVSRTYLDDRLDEHTRHLSELLDRQLNAIETNIRHVAEERNRGRHPRTRRAPQHRRRRLVGLRVPPAHRQLQDPRRN